MPVLYLNKSGTAPATDLSDQEYINYITPDELFGANAILIKGRNIFSPKTEFYLIPKDEGGERDFVNWCDDRKEQKLNILFRNSKEYQVVVSYDPSILQSGYYALEVRNPGDNKDSIDVLVLDNSPSQISPDKGFEIDSHYSVNSISITNSASYDFSITGKNLNSTTNFFLEPTAGNYSYPFETSLTRNSVKAEVTGTFKQGGGSVQVTLSCPTVEFGTGYYNLVARNWDGTVSKFLCLVKKPFDNDYTKAVSKLKTKFNKKTEYVDVTLQDEKFSADKTYTLVSEYDEKTDSNNKIVLSLHQDGKKLEGKLTPDQLTIAKYALIIEDAYSYDVIYCEINNTLKITQEKMNQSTIEKTFFRPVGKDSQITLDTDDTGSVNYYDNKLEMTKYMPFFFTNFHFDMSLLPDSSVVLDLELDLLNFQYASFTMGYEYKTGNGTSSQSTFSMLRFAFPNPYISPFIGAGMGVNIIWPHGGVNSFNDALGMFTHKDEFYGIAQAGIVLFTVLDVRYNLFFNNMFSDHSYFSDSISFGFSFPLRAYKFKRNVISRYAQITKQGYMNVTEFFDSGSDVDEVDILQSVSVGGFEDYSNITKVTIDSTVMVLEENAFRNCKNLSSVTFANRFSASEEPLTIKSGAFADDVMIDTVYLPYRTKVIQNGAFANWTNGQNIILSWNADDETERDLSGLMYCDASVHYMDGTLFKGSFNNPLENEKNWVHVNEIIPENVSVYHEDKYALGVRFKGFGYKWYRTELDSWINQNSSEEALDYIKQGDRIIFKVQGDGNSYNFVMTTEDGGYFYYKFKTRKDVLMEIEIPYKKLKKYSFSSQKKLELEDIKMFCILPMCKDEWNEVTFFDFEVTSK